jgi:hypothetical protein
MEAMQQLLLMLRSGDKLGEELKSSIEATRVKIVGMQPLLKRHRNTVAVLVRRKARLLTVDVELSRLEAERSILVTTIEHNEKVVEQIEEEMGAGDQRPHCCDGSDEDLEVLIKDIGAAGSPKVRAAVLRYKARRNATRNAMDIEDTDEERSGVATPIADDGYAAAQESPFALATPNRLSPPRNKFALSKTGAGGVKATIGKQQIRLFGKGRRLRLDAAASDGEEGVDEADSDGALLFRDPYSGVASS